MIKIIFLDVDGCLSDGKIAITNFGDEMKFFDVKDGFALQAWNELGFISAIISGGSSKIIDFRCQKLGIKYNYQGIKDKKAIAEEILAKEKLTFEEAACIGDDYNDAKLLQAVKFSYKPFDAIEDLEVYRKLSKKGGNGAVREMIEDLLKKNQKFETWKKIWL